MLLALLSACSSPDAPSTPDALDWHTDTAVCISTDPVMWGPPERADEIVTMSAMVTTTWAGGSIQPSPTAIALESPSSLPCQHEDDAYTLTWAIPRQ